MYKKETRRARADRRDGDVAAASRDCEPGIRPGPIPHPPAGRADTPQPRDGQGLGASGRPSSLPVISGRSASSPGQVQHSLVRYDGAAAVDLSVPDVTAIAGRRCAMRGLQPEVLIHSRCAAARDPEASCQEQERGIRKHLTRIGVDLERRAYPLLGPRRARALARTWGSSWSAFRGAATLHGARSSTCAKAGRRAALHDEGTRRP